MPHIPNVVCYRCKDEMRIVRTGITLEAHTKATDEPYYWIAADLWRCEKCGAEVALLAKSPFATAAVDKPPRVDCVFALR